MHLRLPIVVSLVALAAGAAGIRSCAVRPSAISPSAVRSNSLAFSEAPAPLVAQPGGAPGSKAAKAGVGVRETIVVYVAGDVVRAGVYALPARARAADALRAAGGAREDADLVAINLAARLADGDEVAVYPRGAAPAPRARRTAARVRTAPVRKRARRAKHRSRASAVAASEAADLAPDEIVHLNAAGADELATLPGIGPALAARILIVRDTSGPFASLDDLLDVGGMTAAKVDAIAPYVTLE